MHWKVAVLALLLVRSDVVSAKKKKKKSKQKKADIQSNIGESFQPFIIGGSPATPNEYPFFTQMYWDNNPAGCGASVIGNKWLLTAAHCVYGSFVNKNYLRGYPHWKVGSYCRSGNSQGPNCGARESYRFTRFIHIHPQYTPEVLRWDYALIELDAPVNEVPVSIDDGTTFQRLRTGDSVQAIGMGWTNDNRELPEILQEVTNLFLQQCPYTDESILCTNGRNFGTCKGDSGSPGLVRDRAAPAGWVQVGVTSFGRVPCENHNSPDGYARVATAHSWIVRVICPSYAGVRSGLPEFCPPSPSGSDNPTSAPSRRPSLRPTKGPSKNPTASPTLLPTKGPSKNPIASRTLHPTLRATNAPIFKPTFEPTSEPTKEPTSEPTDEPTDEPSNSPTPAPVSAEVESSNDPTAGPTLEPTGNPTLQPGWEDGELSMET